LLQEKGFLGGSFYDLEEAGFLRQRFRVTGISPLLLASRAGAISPKSLGTAFLLKAVGPLDSQSALRRKIG